MSFQFPGSLILVVCLAVASLNPSFADEQPSDTEQDPVSYYRNVRPILQRQCSGCHFNGKQEGGLSVVSVDALSKGGESGSSVIAGKPDDSLLIEVLTGDDPRMPVNADPLPAEEIETLRRWIAEGAKDDTPEGLQREYSAENPPVYSAPPVVTSLDYSPDGQLLAVTGYHEVLIHTLDGSKPVRRLIGRSPRLESLSFSPDGQLLAVAGGAPSLFGELQIWNVAEGKLLQSITMSWDTLFGVSFNAEGTLVAFGGADNRLRIASVESGEIVMRMDAHSDWVLGTIFSLKNDHVISVSRDRSMKLTIVENGQFVDNITSITPGALKGGLSDVVRHPTREEVLSVGADGAPRLYRIFREKARQIGDDFNLLRSFPAMPGRLCDVDITPSGNRFVVGASDALTGSARVYTTDDAAKIVDLQGITSPIFAVSFRQDEKQVAVGGFDGTVRLFNPDTGALEAEFAAAPLSGPSTLTEFKTPSGSASVVVESDALTRTGHSGSGQTPSIRRRLLR
ncbi:MAG: hypothetical protein KDA96_00745 [Planctomycetaceae bacterium]|nr:hypothetical protein [Planctomycetaceae bacterium]